MPINKTVLHSDTNEKDVINLLIHSAPFIKFLLHGFSLLIAGQR
jgi:hypothetical protein